MTRELGDYIQSKNSWKRTVEDFSKKTDLPLITTDSVLFNGFLAYTERSLRAYGFESGDFSVDPDAVLSTVCDILSTTIEDLEDVYKRTGLDAFMEKDTEQTQRLLINLLERAKATGSDPDKIEKIRSAIQDAESLKLEGFPDN